MLEASSYKTQDASCTGTALAVVLVSWAVTAMACTPCKVLAGRRRLCALSDASVLRTGVLSARMSLGRHCILGVGRL